MAMLELKVLPPRHVRVIAVITTWPGWRVVFDNNSQCLIDPDPTPGSRRLYAFSTEIIEHSPWIERYDDVLIVAGMLAFFVVGDRRYDGNIHTLLCEYKGMRS